MTNWLSDELYERELKRWAIEWKARRVWNSINIYNELESWIESLKFSLDDFTTDRWHRSKCLILHKKIINFISDCSSSCDILLSLTHDKQIFESSDRFRNDMKFDHSADEKKENENKVKDKEAEWENKEKFDDDCDMSETSLLFFTKKKCKFVARKRSSSQRRIKRRCCSSSYQNEAVNNQDECEMHISDSRSEWSSNILQIFQL